MATKKGALILGAIFLLILAVIFYYAQQAALQSKSPQSELSKSASEPAAALSAAYTLTEVALHNTPTDCWAAIEGSVYDLSSWVNAHPGGARAITGLCGRDGTADFLNQHGGSAEAASALLGLKIGSLNQ